MAGPYYVRSPDGDDGSDGLTWANAKATLAGALAVAAAGERIWVSQDHAETQATTMTLVSAGTAAAPVEIFCGNDASEPPTAHTTGATVTTTTSVSIVCEGYANANGIIFSGSTSGAHGIFLPNNSNASNWTFEDCSLRTGSTSATGRIVIGGTGSADCHVRWINTNTHFAHASHGITLRSKLDWSNTPSAIGGTTPTELFLLTNIGQSGFARCRGVDLSAITGALVSLANQSHTVLFENCKLGSGVAITSGAASGSGGSQVEVINSDSADTNYRYATYRFEGTEISETTIIRTGGANNGSVGFSRKLTTSASSSFQRPLTSQWWHIDNDTVGSAVSVGFEIVNDGTTFQDDEVWIEVEYLGTSGFPLTLFASDRAADVFATPANQPTSSETWTTTGLTTPIKQSIAVSVTPQEKGLIRARVCHAVASKALYYCPKMVVA